jgi:hypothetical protein
VYSGFGYNTFPGSFGISAFSHEVSVSVYGSLYQNSVWELVMYLRLPSLHALLLVFFSSWLLCAAAALGSSSSSSNYQIKP